MYQFRKFNLQIIVAFEKNIGMYDSSWLIYVLLEHNKLNTTNLAKTWNGIRYSYPVH